jgi:hypothetical protein
MQLRKLTGAEPITQFEYTYEPDYHHSGEGNLQYNLSNRDCQGNCLNKGECPFMKLGFMAEHQGCPTRECKPGDLRCYDAYNDYNDDWANKGCNLGKFPGDTYLFLCNYNVPHLKLRRSKLWRDDMLSPENIVFLETQPKNTTLLH